MYIKDGENIAEFELPKTTYWTKVSMEVWIENETIEIGFDFDTKSGCWVLIDSVQLNFITAIDYENLEKTIKEYETLIEENYTPNSWNIFKANKEVLSAKIEEVKSIDLSKYTEESSIVLKDALYKALNIEADENAMQEAVDEAILKLDEAIKSLVEKIIEPDVDDEIEDDDSIGDSSKDEEDDKDQNPVIEDTKKNPTINDNIRKEESTEKDKGTGKLPITGKESELIFISFAAVIIGITFLKKRKKA